MKKTKTIIAFVLVLMLVFALCGCGEKKADNNAGVYKTFGIKTSELGDFIVDSTGMLDMTITLNSDGTGNSVNDGETVNFNWSVSGEDLTIKGIDGEIKGILKNGVMEIKITQEGTEVSAYLAKDGADTSAYEVLSMTELVSAVAGE